MSADPPKAVVEEEQWDPAGPTKEEARAAVRAIKASANPSEALAKYVMTGELPVIPPRRQTNE